MSIPIRRGSRSPRRPDVCGLTAFPHGTGVGMEPASGQAIARGHSPRAVPSSVVIARRHSVIVVNH